MQEAIEVVAAINLLVMGVSHIVLRRTWAEFFVMLHAKGTVGAFIHGFLTIAFGSIVVAFHNVWIGIPVVLTVVGWLYVIKAVLVFCVPGFGAWSLGHASVERAHVFIAPGIFMIAIGLMLVYSLLAS